MASKALFDKLNFSQGAISLTSTVAGQPGLQVKGPTGQTSNTAEFYANGSATASVVVDKSGNVGIGTNAVNTNGIMGLGSAGAYFPAPTGTAPLYACRAFASFDGTTNLAYFSKNCSVTRTGTGAFTITFTTSMASTNYTVLLLNSVTASSRCVSEPRILSKSTSACTITTSTIDNTNINTTVSVNPTYLEIAVFA